MHLLFEFLPIILFFVAYKVADIFIATAAAMAATIVQILYLWFKNKKIEKGPVITLVAILVLGGATLFFHDELFIKWKPTVVYWLLSAFIVVNKLMSNAQTTKKLLGEKMTLQNHVWTMIDNITVYFFLFLGALNLYIAYSYDTAVWVNFKLFGTLLLTVLFCVSVSYYIAKNAETIEASSE
jgi:intracellular septation protein|tara:strand:- start:1871 stop:2416 length:546 start_codon:yes stop_codon:yes gene_type:complete